MLSDILKNAPDGATDYMVDEAGSVRYYQRFSGFGMNLLNLWAGKKWTVAGVLPWDKLQALPVKPVGNSKIFLKESWFPGEKAYFEYHCLESHQSADAELWYRSHQEIEILSEEDSDAWDGATLGERTETGHLKVYKVKFSDGFMGTAMEDELFVNPAGFYRPDPPPRPSVQLLGSDTGETETSCESVDIALLRHEINMLRNGIKEVAREVMDTCKHQVAKGRSLDNINLDSIIESALPKLRIRTEDGYVFEKQDDGTWSDGDMVFDDLDQIGVGYRFIDEDDDAGPSPR